MMVRAWKHQVKNCVKNLVAVVSGGTNNKSANMVIVGLQPVTKRPDDGIFFVEGERDKRLVTFPSGKRLDCWFKVTLFVTLFFALRI